MSEVNILIEHWQYKLQEAINWIPHSAAEAGLRLEEIEMIEKTLRFLKNVNK